MKSYIYHYRAIVPSACRVYIHETEDEFLIGFENMEGHGTSVTNASEHLATEIVLKENLPLDFTRFFEWYPEYEGDVSEITYQWKGIAASKPDWKYHCNAEENPFNE